MPTNVRYNNVMRGDEYWGLGVITNTTPMAGGYQQMKDERGADKREIKYNPMDKVPTRSNHCEDFLSEPIDKDNRDLREDMDLEDALEFMKDSANEILDMDGSGEVEAYELKPISDNVENKDNFTSALKDDVEKKDPVKLAEKAVTDDLTNADDKIKVQIVDDGVVEDKAVIAHHPEIAKVDTSKPTIEKGIHNLKEAQSQKHEGKNINVLGHSIDVAGAGMLGMSGLALGMMFLGGGK